MNKGPEGRDLARSLSRMSVGCVAVVGVVTKTTLATTSTLTTLVLSIAKESFCISQE